MNYFTAKIGCNIVRDPDTEDSYTEALYEEELREYSGLGFSHVEFSHVVKLNIPAAKRLRALSQKLGIQIWSLHSEHLNDSSREEEYYNIERHCAEIGKALGINVAVCHLPNIENRANDFERDLRIIRNVLEIFRTHGIRLAIETCEKNDVDYIIRLIDTINDPFLGANIDTGHVYCNIIHDVGSVIRKFGERIITLHLQDNFGENDDHQMPGMGYIDWHDVIAALKEANYCGPLMMEMTGIGVKARRTVEKLRDYCIEKERIQGAAYLDWLWKSTAGKK